MEQEHLLSDEDFRIAVEIMRKALDARPQIKRAILGADLAALSPEEQIKESSTTTIAIYYHELSPDIPRLYLRLVSSRLPVLDIIFSPYESILAFLGHARDYVLQLSPPITDEEKEKAAFGRAFYMTIIMLDSIHRRVESMMDSFTREVVTVGHILNRNELQHFRAARGERLSFKDDKSLKETLENHSKDLNSFWKGQAEIYQSWQQLYRFAETYPVTYKHWKSLSSLARENENWRQYAKAGDFQDTPDDLLDRLQNKIDRLDSKAADTRLSHLALEHAGRRVGLINTRRFTDAAIKRRKGGIKVTGYTNSQLFNLLEKGQETLKSLRVENTSSGKAKHRKSAQKKSGN